MTSLARLIYSCAPREVRMCTNTGTPAMLDSTSLMLKWMALAKTLSPKYSRIPWMISLLMLVRASYIVVHHIVNVRLVDRPGKAPGVDADVDSGTGVRMEVDGEFPAFVDVDAEDQGNRRRSLSAHDLLVNIEE